MKNLILAILLFTVSLTATAQSSESRSLDSFSKLSVGNAIELIMEKGNTNTARIETSGVETDKVLTKISGSSLSIFMKDGDYKNSKDYKSGKVKVYLTYNGILDAIKVSNSASLKAHSVVASDRLNIEVSNSGTAELEAQTRELEVSVYNSGKANLEANTETLDVNVMNSGKLNLVGRTNSQKLNIMNSGKFMAYDFKSERVDARISGSGQAEIWVSKELVADAMNSGKISYKGNPEKVLVDATNSARISSSN